MVSQRFRAAVLICVFISLIVLATKSGYFVKKRVTWNIKRDTGLSQEDYFAGPVIPSSGPFLIPSDGKLHSMTEPELFLIYWTYINTIQVLCQNQMRAGSLQDGGKEVCLDGPYKPNNPCLVYSFGSNNQFDFEESIAKNFNCEIHVFDPSIANRELSVPPLVTFHHIGIGGADTVTKDGWRLKTLNNIMRELHHENATIDVLKMDIEGGEWSALPQMFETGVMKKVKQINLETHYDYTDIEPLSQLKSLRQLYEQGFRIYMHERNSFVGVREGMTRVTELAFVNVK